MGRPQLLLMPLNEELALSVLNPAARCKVSCAVGHGNPSLVVTATCSQPWSTRSHMRRDLPSVHNKGFRISCSSGVFEFLLFPISGNSGPQVPVSAQALLPIPRGSTTFAGQHHKCAPTRQPSFQRHARRTRHLVSRPLFGAVSRWTRILQCI